MHTHVGVRVCVCVPLELETCEWLAPSRKSPTKASVKTRRWECDRPGVEPTSSGPHDWGQYHSSEKVSCDERYWNPSPHISGYMCGARRVVRGLCCSQHTPPIDVPMNDPDTCTSYQTMSKPVGGNVTERESNPRPLGRMTGDSTTRLKRSAVMSGTGIHRLIYRDICVERGASYAACAAHNSKAGSQQQGGGLQTRIVSYLKKNVLK